MDAIAKRPGHPSADTGTTARRPTGRLHALDGLRAVAVTLVVAHHLGVSAIGVTLVDRGHSVLGRLVGGMTASGVELFFVMSAIVLARPYVRGERPFRLGRYLSRRVERLYPPFLAAWLFAGFAVYLATRYPTWWTTGSSLPSFTWSNWLSQAFIVYGGHEPFNFAWWSLTPEVVFYLLLPLLVPWMRRIRSAPAGGFGTLAIAAALAIVAHSPAFDGLPAALRLVRPFAVYASCFCAGLLLAGAVPRASRGPAWMAAGLLWVLIAARWDILNPHVGWGLFHFGLAIVALSPSTALAGLLSRYVFVWLGERSYSIFLTHFTVVGLVAHATSLLVDGKSWAYLVVTRVASLAVSLLVGMLLFEGVEKRFARNLVTTGVWRPWRKRSVDETSPPPLRNAGEADQPA